jgi:hypothetical protein
VATRFETLLYKVTQEYLDRAYDNAVKCKVMWVKEPPYGLEAMRAQTRYWVETMVMGRYWNQAKTRHDLIANQILDLQELFVRIIEQPVISGPDLICLEDILVRTYLLQDEIIAIGDKKIDDILAGELVRKRLVRDGKYHAATPLVALFKGIVAPCEELGRAVSKTQL